MLETHTLDTGSLVEQVGEMWVEYYRRYGKPPERILLGREEHFMFLKLTYQQQMHVSIRIGIDGQSQFRDVPVTVVPHMIGAIAI